MKPKSKPPVAPEPATSPTPNQPPQGAPTPVSPADDAKTRPTVCGAETQSTPSEPASRAQTPIFAWGLGSGRYLHAILREKAAVVHVFALDFAANAGSQARAVILGDAVLKAAVAQGRLLVYLAAPASLCHRFTQLSRGLDDARVHIHRPILPKVPPEARALAHRLEGMARSRERALKMQGLLRANLQQNLEAIAAARPLRSSYIEQRSELAFVLAAGPSLAPLKPLLQKCQQKGALIAVDTAMRTLDPLDILADWVCCTDGHDISIQHFPCERWSACNFAFSATATPRLVEQFHQRWVAVPAGDPFSEAVQAQLDIPIRRCHGTVLGLALHTALSLQARKVVLLGADFSYVGGLSHAPDSAFVQSGQELSQGPELFVEGWQQQKLPTNSDLQRFHQGIQEIIRIDQVDAPRQGRTPREFFSVDGGGARIEGCQRIEAAAFEKWLDQLPDRKKPSPQPSQQAFAPDEIQQRRDYLEQTLKELSETNTEPSKRPFQIDPGQ